MTDFHSGVTPAHIANAVEATQAICALPAIATQDWCDLAAEAIALIAPDAHIGVAIGQIDAEGNFINVEAAGAAGPEATSDALTGLRNRYAGTKSLGWSLGDPAKWRHPQATRIGETPVGFVWPSSNGGRVWTSLGAKDVIVGAASLTGAAPSRVFVVEIGANREFSEADVALLRSVLAPIAKRAMIAFGDEPINASRMLTPREQEILEHLALGKSVREIAEQLSRSPHTVHDHVKALHRKLRASSRGALIARSLGHNVREHKPQAKAANSNGRASVARYG